MNIKRTGFLNYKCFCALFRQNFDLLIVSSPHEMMITKNLFQSIYTSNYIGIREIDSQQKG